MQKALLAHKPYHKAKWLNCSTKTAQITEQCPDGTSNHDVCHIPTTHGRISVVTDECPARLVSDTQRRPVDGVDVTKVLIARNQDSTAAQLDQWRQTQTLQPRRHDPHHLPMAIANTTDNLWTFEFSVSDAYIIGLFVQCFLFRLVPGSQFDRLSLLWSVG